MITDCSEKESAWNVRLSLISKIHRGKNQGVLLSLSPKIQKDYR